MNDLPGDMRDAVALDESDNVATALRDLAAGEEARVETGSGISRVRVEQPIARCHKFAIADIGADEHVRKYGETIGAARGDIAAGQHVHVHNLVSLRARRPAKPES